MVLAVVGNVLENLVSLLKLERKLFIRGRCVVGEDDGGAGSPSKVLEQNGKGSRAAAVWGVLASLTVRQFVTTRNVPMQVVLTSRGSSHHHEYKRRREGAVSGVPCA